MNRAGVITTYTYDANDRLLTEASSAGTFTSTYDANGNLKTRGNGTNTDSYTYDAENRLISASVQNGTNPGPVSYTYDADGMRTSKTTGGVTTTFLTDKNAVFSGATTACGCKSRAKDLTAQVVVEMTGVAVVTYTYGNQLISQTRTGGGTHFYLTDGHLSTRQLTSSAGLVSDTYTYDAFGVTLASTGTTQNVYLYTGEQFDANVGFYYLRARYYAQTQGRFVTTDPEEGNIFDPVSLHRYLYANADPVNNRDPSGRMTLLQIVNIGLIIVIFTATLFGEFFIRQQPIERALLAAVKSVAVLVILELLGLAIASIGPIAAGAGSAIGATKFGKPVLEIINYINRFGKTRDLIKLEEYVERLSASKKFFDELPAALRLALCGLGSVGLTALVLFAEAAEANTEILVGALGKVTPTEAAELKTLGNRSLQAIARIIKGLAKVAKNFCIFVKP
jgi:RHS repeat-associated protein